MNLTLASVRCTLWECLVWFLIHVLGHGFVVGMAITAPRGAVVMWNDISSSAAETLFPMLGTGWAVGMCICMVGNLGLMVLRYIMCRPLWVLMRELCILAIPCACVGAYLDMDVWALCGSTAFLGFMEERVGSYSVLDSKYYAGFKLPSVVNYTSRNEFLRIHLEFTALVRYEKSIVEFGPSAVRTDYDCSGACSDDDVSAALNSSSAVCPDGYICYNSAWVVKRLRSHWVDARVFENDLGVESSWCDIRRQSQKVKGRTVYLRVDVQKRDVDWMEYPKNVIGLLWVEFAASLAGSAAFGGVVWILSFVLYFVAFIHKVKNMGDEEIMKGMLVRIPVIGNKNVHIVWDLTVGGQAALILWLMAMRTIWFTVWGRSIMVVAGFLVFAFFMTLAGSDDAETNVRVWPGLRLVGDEDKEKEEVAALESNRYWWLALCVCWTLVSVFWMWYRKESPEGVEEDILGDMWSRLLTNLMELEGLMVYIDKEARIIIASYGNMGYGVVNVMLWLGQTLLYGVLVGVYWTIRIFVLFGKLMCLIRTVV